MPALSEQRCFNHAGREAVARCPECGRFFCRECITEHEDRVVCARCLRHLVQQRLARRFHLVGLLRLTQTGGAILLIWIVFYLLGLGLLALPSSFHEGTIWENPGWETEARPGQ